MVTFSALRCGRISLYLVDTWNLRDVSMMVFHASGFERYRQMLCDSYAPAYDDKGERTRWGFYARVNGQIVGLSQLWISEEDESAHTGADTFPHMRGQGIASDSKAGLFYLGFELLGLERIHTACVASNAASKASIEKTPGFQFSGVFPGTRPNSKGEVEEEFRYVIEREDWKRLYENITVEILK